MHIVRNCWRQRRDNDGIRGVAAAELRPPHTGDGVRPFVDRWYKTRDKASALQDVLPLISFLVFNIQLFGGVGPAGGLRDVPSGFESVAFESRVDLCSKGEVKSSAPISLNDGSTRESRRNGREGTP